MVCAGGLLFGALAAFAAVGCEGRELVLGLGRARNPPADVEDAGAGRDAGMLPGFPEYTEPNPIEAISSGDASDDDPALSGDQLQLFFNSKRDGDSDHEDIWWARRAALAADWGEPQPAAALNTGQRETGIALASSGLRIWFSSDRAGGKGGLDIYTASRARGDDDWSEPEAVNELNSDGDDLVSSVSDSELSLLMARRDDGDSDYDVFSAERRELGAGWDEPRRLASIDSDADESDACYAAGKLLLIFTRDEDLYLAERPDRASEFRVAGEIARLNSDEDDRDPWVADDLSLLLFSSKRSGSYKLYAAERLTQP